MDNSTAIAPSKIKVFGKNRPVHVEMTYEPNPKTLLSQLTQFLYQQASLIDFRTAKPELWVSIFKAILVNESQENKVFQANVADLIAEAKARNANLDAAEE